MFGNLKNLQGLAGLMKNSGEIRAALEEMKSDLQKARIEAETGGGAVRATVSGAMRVIRVEVDPAMFSALVDTSNPDDRGMAEDLIAGAVNAALEKAQRHAADELARRAEQLGLPLPPGVNFANLLGGA